jgi:hypothetical protein
MKIVLERYYGDWRITKSVMTVTGEDAEILLRCEAREPRFAQYIEAFPGCSRCCLACGEFACKVVATEMSPMTLTVVKSPGHRCCRIGWDYVAQVKANTVLVGESDGYELDEYRDIVRSKETFDRLTALVYQAYATGEKISLEVKNKVLFGRELSEDSE